MIELVGVFVKDLYRRDVLSLAPGACANRLALFYGIPSLLQLSRARRCPERMVVAHRDAPVRNAASRVGDGNFGKRLFSLFILERMEPGDGAIELPPGLRATGNVEVDPPELF